MVSVLSLLVPIALSPVFVFIASSIIHLATPNGFPRPGSMADMKSPAFLEKLCRRGKGI